ncbi:MULTISPECIES: VOC family protein [Pseudomonas]|jgi:catechol 2,3-dioxygenase-like lactoylglutathione lyase family enzyme|uniref:VOC family protein n=1 Tax=Pseudomonas TaxID=286 RepID=UPI000DA7E45B|nr:MULTISPECIES: VOC family protein [Pseudomonas]MDW3710352.1 VOC family protein [Pseudomonas sp. 2023EL-01195]PZE12668.1 VOC family protein [Pseudomonas sp. 57B-090624]
MPVRPSRLNGLRHLAIVVPNLEECERFYVDILGMQVLNRAHEDLVYLTCGNDNLSLGRSDVPSSGMQAVDHYGFVVDSLDELHAWYDYLKACGVTLLDRPFAHGDGAHSFHVLDPAGNKIQPIYHPAISGQRFGSPL